MVQTNVPTLGAPVPRRFTAGEYHQMANARVLAEDERTELIRGEIIAMPPIGSRHAACMERLADVLRQSLSGGLMLRSQQPIGLSDLSEPEPDIAVVTRRAGYYAVVHPRARDVQLIIEVADSSVGFDRDEKLPLYAQHSIPEYWIVDLNADRIEVHTDPHQNWYGLRRLLARGEVLVSEALGGKQFPTDQLLPAPITGD